MEIQKNLEEPKQSWERRMELEESTCLTSDYTTKPHDWFMSMYGKNHYNMVN